MASIRGTFEVEVKQEPPYDTRPGAKLGRSTVEKRFTGPLEGTGHVDMLGAMTDVKGSAGYVGLERVAGTLEGKRGTFVLQHSGAMDRGAMSLRISVVPDSATDELVGLRGTMTIEIVDGKHFYAFDYTLAP